MKSIKAIIVGIIFVSFSASLYADCPEGELKFSFKNLEVRMAFALIADYARLKPSIEQSIIESAPVNFDCTPWREAATNLANRFQLSLRIENGVMYVGENK